MLSIKTRLISAQRRGVRKIKQAKHVRRKTEVAQEEDLRVSTDEHYRDMVAQKKISNGMNRREVIQAWGFFEDHNVLRKDDGQTVFEQLLFENSRQVYLKNGLVCFSSE